MDRHAARQKPARRITRRQVLAFGLASAASSLTNGKLNADDRKSPGSTLKRLVKPEAELRERAICDYRQSMQQFGGSLSSPIDRLLCAEPNSAPWMYDIVVIGSGYGASICGRPTCLETVPRGKSSACSSGARNGFPAPFPVSCPN
jgi:hypothetical protein